MPERSSQSNRTLAAGVAAVVLTLAAGGAAVAVSLGAGSGVDSPAGKLSATEPISGTDPAAAAPTPSTIYVDQTIPAPTPPSDPPRTAAGSGQASVDSHDSGDHDDDRYGEHDEGADDDD